MPGALLFALQVSITGVVAALAARWYLVPWLARQPFARGIEPLLLLHATRVVGLSFLARAVRGEPIPFGHAAFAAGGDTATALLALASLGLVRHRHRGARVAVALTNVVGLTDIIVVAIWGVFIDFPELPLGATWFIPTELGPVMVVTHVAMFWFLWHTRGEVVASPVTER